MRGHSAGIIGSGTLKCVNDCLDFCPLLRLLDGLSYQLDSLIDSGLACLDSSETCDDGSGLLDPYRLAII